MGTNSGVNLEQNVSNNLRAEIHINMERVDYHRDQPPPYTELDAHPNTIIRETIIVQPPLKDAPMLYPCGKCYKRVMTKVDYVNTKKTHMIAGFVFGFTCWCLMCCLACIPYIIPTFKRVNHYCSECNSFLGNYSKI